MYASPRAFAPTPQFSAPTSTRSPWSGRCAPSLLLGRWWFSLQHERWDVASPGLITANYFRSTF